MKNYRPLPIFLTIAPSNIEGLGLFTRKKIDSHIILGISHYQIEKKWIRTPLGGFINHSEDSNCKKLLINTRFYLLTKRVIEPDEELTLTYTLYNITYS